MASVTLPTPIKEVPLRGTPLWSVTITNDGWSSYSDEWDGWKVDKMRLREGLLFRTQDEANAYIAALRSL